MARILEKQAKQLVVEANSTGQGGATFTVGQGEQWAGVALPLVRKVFGSLSTKEFMLYSRVQPTPTDRVLSCSIVVFSSLEADIIRPHSMPETHSSVVVVLFLL